jgi:tetratricopeptide (TPR) repeat protein
LSEDALAAYRALAQHYKEAVWTRGVSTKKSVVETAPDAGTQGKTYALLIGISKYKHDPPVESLQFADKDAELFAQLLQKPRGGGLKAPDEIRVLTNEAATRAGIDAAVQHFVREKAGAEKQNTLILFVGGHGIFLKTEEDPVTHRIIERDPYVLTYESNPQDPKTTAYPMAELRSMLAEQANVFRRVLVFVDVCHSNQIGSMSGLDLEPAVRDTFTGQRGEFGMMLATKDLAFESDLFGDGHGAFTYFLVSGWNGAAATEGAKTVEFEDLAQYVEQKVSRFTNKTQIPEKVDPNPALVITPDITKEGITLPPANPLPKEATKRIRRRGLKNDIGVIEETAPTGSSRALETPSFEDALAAGLLLPDEEGSALRILARMKSDAAVSGSQLRELEDRLLVALEDRGQQTILRYLEGDQIPQDKADFARGARYFEEALQLAPGSSFDESRMLFCQGRTLLFDHAYAQARTLLERSIRIDPARAYSYNALGIAYLEQIASSQANFDLCIRAFHDAIRFAPDWVYPRHNLALAYGERGDYAAAIRTYQEAMRLAPHYSYLPYNLGLLYQRLNDWPQAGRYYKEAREVTERNRPVAAGARWIERSEIWNALGTLEASRDHASKADSLFRKALQDYPESRNARQNLALLLSRGGESPEAEKYWKEILQADPENLPSLLTYADYLARTSRLEAAGDLYRKVLLLRSDYGAVRMKLAGIYRREGKPELALDELMRTPAESPRNPSLLEDVGDLAAQLGRMPLAVDSWRSAKSLSKDSASRKRIAAKLNAAGVH